MQYNLNYTWSKALDVLSVIGLQYGANSFIQDPHNLAAGYGSQVELNGAGDLNLWTPRTIQMSLVYSF